MKKTRLVAGLALTVLFGVVACDGDDDGMEAPVRAEFDVEVENVSTVYDFPASGNFTTPVGADGPGPLFPGDSYRAEFHAAPGHRLSFATMFVQSNDFFYAPDEQGIALYDESGDPVTGDVTAQVDLWDSGTEVNQEPGLGEDQAPRQAGPDTGAEDPDPTVRLAEDTYDNLPADEEVVRVTIEHVSGTRFALVVENVSTASTLATSDGETHPVPLAPGVFVVHTEPAPLFQTGEPDRGEGLEALAEDGGVAMLTESLADRTGLTSPLAPGVWVVHTEAGPLFDEGAPDRDEGLEALAEDGDPSTLAGSLAGAGGVQSSGVFNTPDGGSSPAPLFPGQTYSFTVTAEEGDRLSLATMLVQSNDLFYAPDEAGIDLFPGGNMASGEITAEFALWDAGTEVNQAPGFGLDQAPRQAGPDTGADEGGNVRIVDDAYTYPPVDAVLRVTITESTPAH